MDSPLLPVVPLQPTRADMDRLIGETTRCWFNARSDAERQKWQEHLIHLCGQRRQMEWAHLQGAAE